MINEKSFNNLAIALLEDKVLREAMIGVNASRSSKETAISNYNLTLKEHQRPIELNEDELELLAGTTAPSVHELCQKIVDACEAATTETQSVLLPASHNRKRNQGRGSGGLGNN